MTENTQEGMFEKPTATEKKKIRECTALVALISFYQDVYGDVRLKEPNGFMDKLDEFVTSVDEQLLKAVLIEHIKKQITKVNKLL